MGDQTTGKVQRHTQNTVSNLTIKVSATGLFYRMENAGEPQRGAT